MKFLRPCIVFLFLLASGASAQLRSIDLPEYTIEPGGASRLLAYTNKQRAFYCGVLNGANTSGFHGITQAKRKLFEQYWIRLGDTLLDPSTADITVTPAGFTRRYPLHNTVEHVFFTDSLALLSVSLTTAFRGDVRVYPGWSVAWRNPVESIGAGMYRLREDPGSGNPPLQGVAAVQGVEGSWETVPLREAATLANPSPLHLPVMFWGRCEGRLHLTVEIMDAQTAAVIRPPAELFTLMKRREVRISSYLASLGFKCSDSATTEAFRWIAASMDALVMNQTGPGIYAGLPWFDDYWGRDTFITFPGALLVTGQYAEARAVLESFLRFMDRDTASATYGRIPNRVQPEDVIYNTVDGTPWMVIQAWNYYRYSGDTAFIRDVYPDIVRTVDGAMRHTDSLGFLTHADAETWMDAVGPEGPWSPRGNRAVDIQALWIGQLRAAAKMASMMDEESRAIAWNKFADTVTARMVRFYSDTSTFGILGRIDSGASTNAEAPANAAKEVRAISLADHLRHDGSKAMEARPNALFPFSILGLDAWAASSPELAASTLWNTLNACVYRWGVASLGQREENFHPFHEAPRFYPKDAAYHNGTIWTWLSGPAVTVLSDLGLQDSAWVLMRTLQRLAMETGAVGTIPENTDALPRPGEAHPRWSGTFSQAWSNAEYLRVMYQDLLGAEPDAERMALRISPALPQALEWMEATVRIGDQRVRVRVERADVNRIACTLSHVQGAQPVTVLLREEETLRLTPGSSISAHIPARTESALLDALPVRPAFCRPRSLDGIATIQPPTWPHIDGATATATNDNARELCSAFDPEGDDRGPSGTFTYPRSGFFRPGSFDLRHFTVTTDDENVYFRIQMRALSQPGWHPEYGFQLTMLAIAIDQTHDTAGQARTIGYNSGYVMPEESGYDRLILVGGGVQVRDADGAILAEFVPETTADAFGDPRTGIISFAIPRIHLGGGFDHWRYTVVAGAQDDHGGAGIGEFRTVLNEAGEWNGGGADGSGANWYDAMRCP